MTRRSVLIAAFASMAFFPCAGSEWLCDSDTDHEETTFAFDGAAGAKFDGEYRWLR